MLKKFFILIFPLLIVFLFLKFFESYAPAPIKYKKNINKKTKNVKTVFKSDIEPYKEPYRIKNTDINYSIIILDPGHGGDDTGYIGINNIKESDVALNFTFIFARALRMKGFSVYLTRNGDYNTTEEARLEVALEHKAAMFISVHCAYSKDTHQKGFNIFGFSSVQGVSKIENMENWNLNINENNVYFEKIETAKKIEEEIAQMIKLKTGLIETNFLKRGFFVPISQFSNIPAFIIFLGFLSNQIDFKNLNDKFYLEKIANNLAEAIEKGFYTNVSE